MCFNSNGTEDFGRSSSGGVPVPSSKPSPLNGSTGGSILGQIWDDARGIFTRVASIELERRELERLADLRAAEEAAAIRRNQTLAGTVKDINDFFVRDEVQISGAVIGAGMIAVAAILLLRS